MLEVKMFSTIYPQGDEGNVRCQYDTRFLSSDKLGHTVCIYGWCLQLLYSVIILQMIVTYFICQKRVEESLSWQTLGVNRARQVFKDGRRIFGDSCDLVKEQVVVKEEPGKDI